ncbi:MAG: TolC family protein [Gemmatimonadota bacterium]|nr:MAG: TolC family protein [Gemmatimonadota bacterium]
MRSGIRYLMLLALPLLGAAAARGAAAQEPAVETYSLGQALQTALANSRNIEDAEYGYEVANQQVKQAWGSVFPDISASASYSRSLLKQQIFLPAEFFGGNPGELRPITVGSDNNWQAQFTLSQPLFEYGVIVGVGAANRYRGLKEEELRGTTQGVVLAVRQRYFDALLASELLRLVEESMQRIGATLEETRAMYRAGLTSSYDVLRFEVEYSSVEAQLERARNGVRARKRELLVEMGLNPGLEIELEGRLNDMDLDTLDNNDVGNREILFLAGAPDSLLDQQERLRQLVLTQRSDLRQIRATISLEEARLSAEKGEFYPRISLFSNYNVLAQQDGSLNFFGDAGSSRYTTAAAGLSIEIPIFRGGSRFARVHEVQNVVRQQETRLARAELDAGNEVRNLVDAVSEARQRAASQRRSVVQARRGFEIASVEYREGIGSQLQMTDAEEALRQAEYGYAQAVYDYLSARAQLDTALGTAPEAPGEISASGG